MKQLYSVAITETLSADVEIEANDKCEAEQLVSDKWKDGDCILGAENFTDVNFKAKNVTLKERAMDDKNAEYAFSFKEITTGSVSILATHRPTRAEVIDAIQDGAAAYKNTEYVGITCHTKERTEAER
ncbi:MAG: DpnD/PcfM family protein [Oscillospiraceae bacterium]